MRHIAGNTHAEGHEAWLPFSAGLAADPDRCLQRVMTRLGKQIHDLEPEDDLVKLAFVEAASVLARAEILETPPPLDVAEAVSRCWAVDAAHRPVVLLRIQAGMTTEEVAEALYETIGDGPMCFNHPTDEWVCRRSLEAPRDEAIRIWRGVQETSLRKPERQAR